MEERINEASDKGSDNTKALEETPSRYGKETLIQTRRTLVGTVII